MRRLFRWLLILGIPAGLVYAASGPIAAHLKERARVIYREAEVSRGKVTAVVNSTGTVKPVRSVSIGAFVSGPIESIRVDFNTEVKTGELLAKIDPRLLAAAVAGDKAQLATRKAEVARVTAELQQAKNDEGRSKRLRTENPDFISDAEMDQYKFKRMSLEASLAVAERSVEQAQAALDNALANLNYTEITSPVDGVVIDRKVDPGQTVASQFQTPELFIVAPDMRKEMRVFANVDEADIGLIRDAQQAGQPVRFTVDAYPKDLFTGTIFQIRRNSTTTQNVVTYPVIVSAPNPDLKLLPGMTASISFQVGERPDALRVPNAALRYYPNKYQVHPDDRNILENVQEYTEADDEQQTTAVLSADDKAELRRSRERRHVWRVDGELLRAVAVVTGLSDSKWTEVVSGELTAGQKLVTGVVPK